MFVRNLNPYTAIVFFMFAVVACVLIKQPIALGILTVCGIGYAVQSDRRYALRALWSIPVAAFVVLINPLVNGRGVTVWLTLGSLTVTAESFVYGCVSGMMLIAAAFWFAAFDAYMSADRYAYAFGKVFPSTALLLSMTLRLIPELQRTHKEVRIAMKAAGLLPSGKGRLKGEYRALRATMTRAIEESATRADSMRARGYGIKSRTFCRRYRFGGADAVLLFGSAAAFVLTVVGYALAGETVFFPGLRFDFDSAGAVMMMAGAAWIGMMPILFDGCEVWKWKRSVAKISD